MMNKKISSVKSSSKTSKDIQKFQRISMALEEFVWSLRGAKLDLLQEAVDVMHTLASEPEETSAISRGYRSKDPNKNFLIGVLPRLFQDKALFPQNEDIVDFASGALCLEMSRSEKRSRYEIIGKVICETDTLDEQQLTDLVMALEKLVGNKDKIAQMIEKKRQGRFSWNETIQDLLKS